MSVRIPHYLLFSAAAAERRRAGTDVGEHGPASGNWEFVLESFDGTSRMTVTEEEQDVTGQRLELLAVVRGLEALDQPSRVTLMTTSAYVLRGMRFGLPQWRDNGWQWESYGRMAPVRNADLWQRLDRALQIHQVRCRSWRVDPPAGEAASRQPAVVSQPLSVPQRPPRTAASVGWLAGIAALLSWVLGRPAQWLERASPLSSLCAD